MLFDISRITTDELNDDLFVQQQISVAVLRLDKLHPVVSGNKLFKLHYFLEEALRSDHKTVLTFGGAYSNHMVATAFAGKQCRLKTIGIIRGEKPQLLSATLQECINYEMHLKFISREEYALKDDDAFTHSLQKEFGEYLSVPEGGYHPKGAKGASLIMDLVKDGHYSHIVTAMGTATTLAGLLLAAEAHQTIMGINVLKGMNDMEERIGYLAGSMGSVKQLEVCNDYHFGGYAKKTDDLILFMNRCWQQFQLPLDFVYTAKMLYAVFDLAKNNYFPKGSSVICLHTGGLQGNRSLPVDTLLY